MRIEQPHLLNASVPLHVVVGGVAAFWTVAIVGYRTLFPVLGYSLDYNLSPVPIALYFLLWSVVSFAYFYTTFQAWIKTYAQIWHSALLCLGFAATFTSALYALSFFPSLSGPTLAPATDLLFVTPWYFLPKAFEVLFQQILIATLVLEFYARTDSLSATQVLYGFLFFTAHVFLFALSSAPPLQSISISLWALASTWVFPRLLLRVRGGFVYAYTIHLTSYVILAMILRTWPPPGYLGA